MHKCSHGVDGLSVGSRGRYLCVAPAGSLAKVEVAGNGLGRGIVHGSDLVGWNGYDKNMATTTIKKGKQRPWTTSVFVKQMMAITGLFFVMFLIFHAYGNLKMFIGPEAYNSYAQWLKTDAFYPILPHGGFIWTMRIVMLVLIVTHVLAAFHVWHQSRAARKQRYHVKKMVVEAYAARTMRFTGVALIFFITFHLMNFTTLTFQTGFTPEDSPYVRMVNTFQQPIWFVVYLIFVSLVTAHVGHGFWSAFQTMGWVRKSTRKFMVTLSGVLATVMFLMFMLPPLFIATHAIV